LIFDLFGVKNPKNNLSMSQADMAEHGRFRLDVMFICVFGVQKGRQEKIVSGKYRKIVFSSNCFKINGNMIKLYFV
jgi:hypothetical protein